MLDFCLCKGATGADWHEHKLPFLQLCRYLKYWASRAGQDAADIPECEEFELAYSRRAQSLFPFRSTTTEWTVNMAGGAPFLESAFSIPLGVFLLVKYLEYLVRAHRGLISAMSKLSVCAGFVVLLMPWGPFMMLVGFFFGGILGFGLAMANDLCRLRRKTSAAAQQKVRQISHRSARAVKPQGLFTQRTDQPPVCRL